MNRSGFLLAFAALIAALFAPSGFMPARADDGSIVIRICADAGMGDKLVRIDPRTGELQPAAADDSGHQDQRCDFATAGVADLPPIASIAAPQPAFAAFEPAVLGVLADFSETGLPPSTGPPLA